MQGTVAAFLRDESGATAIEYGLIVTMIAVGALLAFTTLGNGLQTLFNNVDERVGNVVENANSNF